MTAEQPNKLSALINRFADWRRRWATWNAALADLSLLDATEYERVAHDVGVNGAELRILAGKWPDSAELLSRRLADLKLDEHRLRDAQPQALRDLQRVCSLCSDKGRCEHDLDRHAKPARWRAYCPNASTLDALIGEPAAPAVRMGSTTVGETRSCCGPTTNRQP